MNIDFLKLTDLVFRRVLGLQINWALTIESPYICSSCPTFPLLLTSCIGMVHLPQLMTDYQHITINWSPSFTLGFTLCIVQFYRFWWMYNGMHTALQYYSEYFHSHKYPLCSIYLSLPPSFPSNPWRTLTFLLFPRSCTLQNVI